MMNNSAKIGSRALFFGLIILGMVGCEEKGNNNQGGNASNAVALTTVEQGVNHACGLWGDGSVRCWGDNSRGQLGLGMSVNHRGDASNEMGDALAEIDLGSAVWATQVTSGADHTCALLNTGAVKCWGSNYFGQLGGDVERNPGDEPGEMGDALVNVNLGKGRTATSIAAGYRHNCALLDDSSIKCWGKNDFGQLGLGDANDRGDSVGEMGDVLPTIDLGSGRTATAVSAGLHHSCALLDDGNVKCWGRNGGGQLGQGDTQHRGDDAFEMGDVLDAVDLGSGVTATAIVAGVGFSCALLVDYHVKCWGTNFYGQLGQGHSGFRGDYPGEMGDNLPRIDLGTGRTATAIGAGDRHACALLDNGDIKCWGKNTYGQLGLGDKNHRGDRAGEMGDELAAVNLGTGLKAVALAVGYEHNCARLDNGTLKCWGANNYGQLGLGDSLARGYSYRQMGDNLLPVNIGTGLHATAIALGVEHSCALLSNSGLKCWGSIERGKLGLSEPYRPGDEPGELASLPAVDLGSGRTATAITVGGYHSCALLDDSSVKCWGENSYGQLGQGDINHRGDEVGEMGDNLASVKFGYDYKVKAISAGLQFTCAIMNNNRVKCWGNNGDGMLGLGDKNHRGDEPNEMGEILHTIDLGKGRRVKSIATGNWHSCALLDNNEVKCWGSNFSGQLGLGDTQSRGNEPGEMDDALASVKLGNGVTVTALSAGGWHSCALLDDGRVKCWGYNGLGQLGLGDTHDRGDEAGEMDDALPAIDLGNGRNVKAISAGFTHSCALLNRKKVKCWGSNRYGELGQGDKQNRGDQPGEMGDNLRNIALGNRLRVRSITTGNIQICAVLSNKTVKCWGGNRDGQLGAGKAHNLGDDAGEMGDNLPAIVY